MANDAAINKEAWERYHAENVYVTGDEDGTKTIMPLALHIHSAVTALLTLTNFRSSATIRDYGINQRMLDSVNPDQFKAIYRALRKVEHLMQRSDKARNELPTIEQAKMAFSCAYYLFDETNPAGKEFADSFKQAAQVLGLGELYGRECLSKPETYAFLEFAKPETVSIAP